MKSEPLICEIIRCRTYIICPNFACVHCPRMVSDNDKCVQSFRPKLQEREKRNEREVEKERRGSLRLGWGNGW